VSWTAGAIDRLWLVAAGAYGLPLSRPPVLPSPVSGGAEGHLFT